jgi:hypothetical protein
LSRCGEDGCETYNLHQRGTAFCYTLFFFLWAEGIQGAQIHLRICAQYGDEVLFRRIVYEWIEIFEDGCTIVTDLQLSGRPAPKYLEFFGLLAYFYFPTSVAEYFYFLHFC